MRKKWIIATRREKFTPTASTRLCSQHFKSTDYETHFGRTILKKDAVPSVFHFPKHLQKKQDNQKRRKLICPEQSEVKNENQRQIVSSNRFVNMCLFNINCIIKVIVL